MTKSEVVLLVLTALGGVALFLYGMDRMTRALENLAGNRLRLALQQLGKRPLAGLLAATGIATAIHSGPTTVMVVGFINAGMLSLVESLPLIFGANLGTTLSMQLVAFDLGVWASGIVALGVLLRMIFRHSFWWDLGNLLLGFGLLFIGLEMIKEPLPAIRDNSLVMDLAENVTALTIAGMLLGILFSTVLTSILMSSGATIAIVFALVDQGILTELSGIFPFILGAHIGTCFLTLIGAMGMSVHAKRAALAHLLFNILGAIIAVLMVDFYLWVVPMTSGSLVRQTANAHTGIQLINTLLFLPFTLPFARLVEWVYPSKERGPETTYLDPSLLENPEAALGAVVLELRRQARVCGEMLAETTRGMVDLDISCLDRVVVLEKTVDSIKASVKKYLYDLGCGELGRRQSVQLQYLNACTSNLERVGDQTEEITFIVREKIANHLWFRDESMEALIEIAEKVQVMLLAIADLLDPDEPLASEAVKLMRTQRREMKRMVAEAKQQFNRRLASGHENPLNGILYMRLLGSFYSVARHLREIARIDIEDEVDSLLVNFSSEMVVEREGVWEDKG